MISYGVPTLKFCFAKILPTLEQSLRFTSLQIVKIKLGKDKKAIFLYEYFLVAIKDTDQKFQDLMTGLESLDDITLKAKARHDWGYGIPMQESGYDVRVKLFEKTGLFSRTEVADFNLRLDYKKQSQDGMFYRGELSSKVQNLATKLGYTCHQTDHSFVQF